MHFSFLSTQLEAHDCEASRTEVRLSELCFVSVNDIYFKPEEDYVYWEFSHAHLTKKRGPIVERGTRAEVLNYRLPGLERSGDTTKKSLRSC
jgi:hypothetical protein